MDRKDIGEAIKKARKAKGYTMQQLADELEVSRVTVTRWECGRYSTTLDTLERIAKALNCEVKVLFEPCR